MLLPQQLNLQVRNELWDQARGYGLTACIECGCCDVVCPSHIPLVEWFRYGKSELRKRALEHAATELARRRFEDREARLARLKQERAEKMARRKQTLRDKGTQQDRIRASIERARHRDASRSDDPQGGTSGDA